MLKDFKEFTEDFNIISLAVGFIVGTASAGLVKSLVEDILMPLIEPLMVADAWREAVLEIGSVTLFYGSFLAELLNFLILLLIIFFIAKKLLKIKIKKT